VPTADETIRLYEDLATLSDRQGQPQMHDRFLVLAADAAMSGGREDEAERVRRRLLQHNPHHLLKPYRSFAEAMQAPDVVSYVVALRRSHPVDASRQLRESLLKDIGPLALEEEPPEGPTVVAEGPDWAVSLDDEGGPEGLKIYKVLDPPEAPKPRAVPPPKPTVSRPKKTDAAEAPRPKPATRQPAPPLAPPRPVLRSLAPQPEEDEEEVPPTMSVPRPRSVPPPPPKPSPRATQRPAVTPSPTPTREVYGLRPDVEARPAAASNRLGLDDPEDGVAGWVAMFLVGMLVVAGTCLAGYTLIRPFLPPG
jgi:hypothetical protein